MRIVGAEFLTGCHQIYEYDTYECRKPTASWRRPPGHPCNVWLNKVQEDANALQLYTLWRSEIARGHAATWRSTRTMRQWWWWWHQINQQQWTKHWTVNHFITNLGLFTHHYVQYCSMIYNYQNTNWRKDRQIEKQKDKTKQKFTRYVTSWNDKANSV